MSGMILLLLLAMPAAAQLKMEVESGYDGRYRAGRWSPVFITVQNDRPINAVVELRVPTASESVINISQRIGIGPEKQTYIIYAPLSLLYDPLRVTLLHADSMSILADYPDRDVTVVDRGNDQVGFLMLTTGRSAAAKNLQFKDVGGSTLSVYQKQNQLPITPMGYDAVDVLLLNNPDWSAISADQQAAIVSWVRAGGVLMIQPGAESVPDETPIASLLPGKLGPLQTVELGADTLNQSSLPERFKMLGVRPVSPVPEASFFTLLNDQVKVQYRAVGLGRIGILPIDVSSLQFNDGQVYQKFWRELITKMTGLREKKLGEYYHYGQNPSQVAALTGLERIGQIPNTGAFGFSYIAVTMIALMLIVGPIDFFVLKKIGRQPWTWATTIGWIGLITTGALYAGHLMRSGDLHFRTLALYDQVDDKLVASEEIALVYAPKSANYAVKSDPHTWWQPVPSGSLYSRGDNILLPIDTHQDYRGNQPMPLWIDIWNFKFLRGSRYLDQPPVMKADLKLAGNVITGTITNLSQQTLKDVEIYYHPLGQSIVVEGMIQPEASREIAINLGEQSAPKKKPADPEHEDAASHSEYAPRGELIKTQQYSNLFEMSEQRSNAVLRSAEAGNVVVFATMMNPKTQTMLDHPLAIVENSAIVRAVLPVGKQP